MLSFRDNLTLATTKLRVRRIRLIITLIVAGVLFTVLVLASLLIRGTLHSLESFTQEGLLNRFLTSTYQPTDYEFNQNPTFISRVEQLEKTQLEAKVKEAKRLGLPFEPAAAPKVISEGPGPDGKKTKNVDITNSLAKQAFVELNPDDDRANLEKLTTGYSVKAIHTIFSLGSYNSPDRDLTPILNGKEVVASQDYNRPDGQDAFGMFSQTLSAYDNTTIAPFLLKGAALESKPGDPIPIIAPVDAAEKLLGLKALDAKASPGQRIARLGELRTKAKALTFDACYRNATAISLRDSAKQQAAEIAASSNVAGYQKPSLIYAAPTTTCAPTTIKSDARNPEEKALAAKQEQFNEAFGAPKPITERISFHVVGLSPQVSSLAQASGPEALIGSLLTSSLGGGWVISREAALINPILSKLMSDPYAIVSGNKSYFVEFTDRLAQKRFLENKGCTNFGSPKECAEKGKIMAFPFGNPLATIYELKNGFDTGLRYVLIGIGILSAIVMMGTIGKIIADSRKETSVFRAVGAKRLDIAQIYLLYTAILASLSFLIALGIGLAAAVYLEASYSPGVSAQAVLAFNSANLNKPFHLIGFSLQDLASIYGFVLAISLFSASIPLLGSLRRNPVKDMREE